MIGRFALVSSGSIGQNGVANGAERDRESDTLLLAAWSYSRLPTYTTRDRKPAACSTLPHFAKDAIFGTMQRIGYFASERSDTEDSLPSI